MKIKNVFFLVLGVVAFGQNAGAMEKQIIEHTITREDGESYTLHIPPSGSDMHIRMMNQANLYGAILQGNSSKVSRLINEESVDVNAKSPAPFSPHYSFNPLLVAASYKDRTFWPLGMSGQVGALPEETVMLEIVNMLINAGADLREEVQK